MIEVQWSSARYRGGPAIRFSAATTVASDTWDEVMDSAFATRTDQLPEATDGNMDTPLPVGGDLSTSSTRAFFITLREDEEPGGVVAGIAASCKDVSFESIDGLMTRAPDHGSITVKWSVRDHLELSEETRFSIEIEADPPMDVSETYEILMVAGKRCWSERPREGWQ